MISLIFQDYSSNEELKLVVAVTKTVTTMNKRIHSKLPPILISAGI